MLKQSRHLRVWIFVMLIVPTAVFAANWTGGGTTGNMSEGANWQGGNAPGANAELDFENTASKKTIVNDLNLSFGDLYLTGDGFSISGNLLTVTSIIAGNDAATSNVISADVNSGIISVTNAGAILEFSGTLTLTNAQQYGAGTVLLNGNVAYAGEYYSLFQTSVLKLGKSTVLPGKLFMQPGAAVEANDFDLTATGAASGTEALRGDGTINMGAGNLTVIQPENGRQANKFTGTINGTGSFTKSGDGYYGLQTGFNLGGAVNINGGTLELTSVTHTAAPVIVSAGATLSAVAATLGDLTVGGTFNGNAGTTTKIVNLTFQSGSTFKCFANGPSFFTNVECTGDVTINNANLDFTPAQAFADGTEFPMIKLITPKSPGGQQASPPVLPPPSLSGNFINLPDGSVYVAPDSAQFTAGYANGFKLVSGTTPTCKPVKLVIERIRSGAELFSDEIEFSVVELATNTSLSNPNLKLFVTTTGQNDQVMTHGTRGGGDSIVYFTDFFAAKEKLQLVFDGTALGGTLWCPTSLEFCIAYGKLDADCDGYPDKVEKKFGTDENNGNVTPNSNQPAPAADPLANVKISVKVDFNNDYGTANISATLNAPAGFNPDGLTAAVTIGNVVRKFTFDAKGKGTGDSSKSSATLGKQKKDGTVTFKAKVDTLGQDVADTGLTNTDQKKQKVGTNATIWFNDKVYTKPVTLIYSAKKGKGSAVSEKE